MSSYRREEGPPLPDGVSYEWAMYAATDSLAYGELTVRLHGGVIFHASTTPESWEPADVVGLLERRSAA